MSKWQRRDEPIVPVQKTKIQLAKKELDMDDDTYREMIWMLAKVRSSKDLTYSQAELVIAHLESKGGFPARAQNGKRKPGRWGKPSAPGDPRGGNLMLSRIEQLLALIELPWSYAEEVLAHQTARSEDRVDALRWATSAQLRAVIAALDKHRKRLLGKALKRIDQLLSDAGKPVSHAEEILAKRLGRPPETDPTYMLGGDLQDLRAVVAQLEIEQAK